MKLCESGCALINVLTFLAIATLVMPAPGFSQWLHYPTADVPRKADGTPDLTAPSPRLADGKPDFSGVWHAARRNPCNPELSRFIPCGIEIGGSPHALNFGVDMPGGPPVPALGGRTGEATDGGRGHRRSTRPLLPRYSAATVDDASLDKGGSHPQTALAAL